MGPIGADIDAVEASLSENLSAVGYTPHKLKLTDLMLRVDTGKDIDYSSPGAAYESKIAYANAVRDTCKNDAALAALAIEQIRRIRSKLNGGEENPNSPEAEQPLQGHAFVIRQLKRPEEIQLLRQVYGRKFVQISIGQLKQKRVELLSRRIQHQEYAVDKTKADEIAQKLVERDENETEVKHGQRVGKIFHLGDVFVQTDKKARIASTLRRFTEALFGKNSISPTRDEYGAYIAASAALRTVDMSRQVGAAVFSSDGTVISLGTNEVPKFGGGTYWGEDEDPHRDIDDGFEPNHALKHRIAFDLVSRLKQSGYIVSKCPDEELFEAMLQDGSISDAQVFDITEYGRMAHAEMNAILDAARTGRSTTGAVLHCTTFPCHNCAKHIVASGISRVVYIEPYEKSQALALHEDSITLDPSEKNKVVFEHFSGISPRRYRDIFEKKKRRTNQGIARTWYKGEALPMIEDLSINYIVDELPAIASALKVL